METLLQDFRYGFRTLVKNSGFTAVAVLALALGIGANTAIFSVVNRVLLRPLPYENPDQLVMIWERNLSGDQKQSQDSPVTFTDWKEQHQIFEKIAGWWYPQINLTDQTGEPERVRTIDTTDDFFSVLGVQPLLGRTFLPGEDRPGGESLAVLSYDLWQRRFGADPNITGKSVTLDGRSHQVIGVMPAGFNFPENTQVWRPLGWDPARHIRSARFFEVVARLKPGVTVERAQSELDALAGRIEQEYPQTNTGWGVFVITLHNQIAGNFRIALFILLGAVSLVLLIACANVANLLLARAGAREKEVAIRLALGATRLRLVRQLLTESILLAILGGALGLLLAYAGGNLLMAVNPIAIPRFDGLQIDSRMLVFTIALTLSTGLIFGIVPALLTSGADLNQTLKEGGRDSRAGASGRRVRGALVVSEIAIALMLLIGAGLLLKSFLRLEQTETGFNPSGLLTLNLQLPASSYPEWPQVAEFYSQLLERIKTIPGVESADATAFLPLDKGWPIAFEIPGQPPPQPGEEQRVQYHQVTPGYFGTMGIPLLAGREFREQEAASRPGVVIINEAMAQRYWPDEKPVGKHLINRARAIGPLARYLPESFDIEVVGIVGNLKNRGLSQEAEPAMFFPQRQFAVRSMSLVVRAGGNPLSIVGAVRNEIRVADRNLPVSGIRTMNEVLGDSTAESRFSLLLLGLFAALALILAMVGIYGVLSYSVTQRKHEIGIRMALGASRGDVMKLILGEGFRLALLGTGSGLIGALALTRVMRSLLFGVSPADLTTFLGVSLLLGVVALLACYLPARRATRIDPMVALRYE